MEKQWKQWQTLFSWAPKHCRWWLQPWRLLLGRKVMTNLDSILKSRDITLPTKVHLIKAIVFPVVMYGCESWTIKKAEHRIIDAFELRCRRRLLRVPWTAKRSSQSILKEISPEYSLEGLMLKLKLHYFGHLMWRTWLIGKDPDWRWEEKRTTEDEMVGWHHRSDGREFEQALGVGDGRGSLACCSAWGLKKSDTTEPLNWTNAEENVHIFKVSVIAQLVKNLPVMQETLVRFLGWEDSPEKGKAANSSILAWRIQSTESQSRTRLTFTSLVNIWPLGVITVLALKIYIYIIYMIYMCVCI